MKRANVILSAVGLVLALSGPGWAQTRTLPTQTVTLSGTVETIDLQKRVVNIKTPDGKFTTVDRSGSGPGMRVRKHSASAGLAKFNQTRPGERGSIRSGIRRRAGARGGGGCG